MKVAYTNTNFHYQPFIKSNIMNFAVKLSLQSQSSSLKIYREDFIRCAGENLSELEAFLLICESEIIIF
jgi:hypothetical protein